MVLVLLSFMELVLLLEIDIMVLQHIVLFLPYCICLLLSLLPITLLNYESCFLDPREEMLFPSFLIGSNFVPSTNPCILQHGLNLDHNR